MIKAYFFDMDGTLVDTEPVWCESIQWALGQRGVDISLSTATALEYGRSFYELYGALAERWPGLFRDIQDMGRLTTQFFEETTRDRDLGIKSSLRLLRRLSVTGVPIYVVTGSVQDRVRKNLENCGVLDCVTGIVSSDDYHHGKPHPEAYQTAARLAGAKPEECVAFEDALTGIMSAKNAGMWCVALNRLEQPDYGGYRLADVTLTSLEAFSLDQLKGEKPRTLEIHQVALGLGGNMGKTEHLFQEARRRLEQGGLMDIRMSSLLVTKPVDCVPGTPDFRNGALVGTWYGSPEDLLNLTQSIERQLGRPAEHSSHESRTVDLDILLIDDLKISSPRLTVPHPRLAQRRFALEPLNELAPDWTIASAGMTVREALSRLD